MFSHLRELRRNLCVVWLASTKYSHCNWKAQFHEKRRKINKSLDCKFFSTFAIIPGIAIVSWRQIAEVSLKLSSIRRQAAGALQLVRFSNWLHRAGWETWLHYTLPYTFCNSCSQIPQSGDKPVHQALLFSNLKSGDKSVHLLQICFSQIRDLLIAFSVFGDKLLHCLLDLNLESLQQS